MGMGVSGNRRRGSGVAVGYIDINYILGHILDGFFIFFENLINGSKLTYRKVTYIMVVFNEGDF